MDHTRVHGRKAQPKHGHCRHAEPGRQRQHQQYGAPGADELAQPDERRAFHTHTGKPGKEPSQSDAQKVQRHAPGRRLC